MDFIAFNLFIVIVQGDNDEHMEDFDGSSNYQKKLG
jgi:hypothetical protein